MEQLSNQEMSEELIVPSEVIAQEDTVEAPTFLSILANTDCDCLENSQWEAEVTFIKKIDGPELKEKDFVTYWEKGKQPATDACEDDCGLRGISINRLDNELQLKKILQVYKETLTIKPNGKTKYIKFSIKLEAGRYKHTPTTYSNDHHDFYKADGFSINRISVQEVGPVQ